MTSTSSKLVAGTIEDASVQIHINHKINNSFAMENPENFGDGRLECTVTSPQKENGGTKDVYISFLVTTKVACLALT
jgi:hypothetical protein